MEDEEKNSGVDQGGQVGRRGGVVGIKVRVRAGPKSDQLAVCSRAHLHNPCSSNSTLAQVHPQDRYKK